MIHAADEKRTVLLREHRGMFGRQSKTFFCSVVVQITSRRHSAQPLAQIAFVQVRSRRELRRCRRPLLRQILEQAQSIANCAEQRRHCAANLLDHFSNELLLTSRIDCSRISHKNLSVKIPSDSQLMDRIAKRKRTKQPW